MTGEPRGRGRPRWWLACLAGAGLVAGLVSACAQAPVTPSSIPPAGTIDNASRSSGPMASGTLGSPDKSATAAPVSTPIASPIELQGQMGIKLGAWQAEPARGMSFGFFFQGQVERGSLSLMTPLGSQVALVEWTPTSATLRRIGPGGGEDIQRGSIEELAETALGEALPLQTLVHWMQGHPDPGLPHSAMPEAGTFEQRGWLIDTRDRAQGRILATRQGQPGLRDARIQVRLDP